MIKLALRSHLILPPITIELYQNQIKKNQHVHFGTFLSVCLAANISFF